MSVGILCHRRHSHVRRLVYLSITSIYIHTTVNVQMCVRKNVQEYSFISLLLSFAYLEKSPLPLRATSTFSARRQGLPFVTVTADYYYSTIRDPRSGRHRRTFQATRHGSRTSCIYIVAICQRARIRSQAGTIRVGNSNPAHTRRQKDDGRLLIVSILSAADVAEGVGFLVKDPDMYTPKHGNC